MKRDDQYFFVGLISFLMALFLIPCGVFIIPAAFLGVVYYIPPFITGCSSFVQSFFYLDYMGSLRFIARICFLSGLFCAVLAYFTSGKLSRNIKIEEYIHEKDDPAELQRIKDDRREFLIMLLKYFVIFIGVIIVTRLALRIFYHAV